MYEFFLAKKRWIDFLLFYGGDQSPTHIDVSNTNNCSFLWVVNLAQFIFSLLWRIVLYIIYENLVLSIGASHLYIVSRNKQIAFVHENANITFSMLTFLLNLPISKIRLSVGKEE